MGLYWSDSLMERTRQALEPSSFELTLTPDGLVHFKSHDGRYGCAEITAIASGKLQIKVNDSQCLETFSDIEELLSAGWVLD